MIDAEASWSYCRPEVKDYGDLVAITAEAAAAIAAIGAGLSAAGVAAKKYLSRD